LLNPEVGYSLPMRNRGLPVHETYLLLVVESSMALLVLVVASRLPSSRKIAQVLLYGVALSLQYATLKLPATERFLTLVGILFQSFAA
jgi:hypothetical protein